MFLGKIAVRLFICGALFALTYQAARAEPFGPAPDGEPPVVAQRVISDSFEPDDCPLVIHAERFGDGSLKARCSNGEDFRIFKFQGSAVAMRCSAARRLGVSGC